MNENLNVHDNERFFNRVTIEILKIFIKKFFKLDSNISNSITFQQY